MTGIQLKEELKKMRMTQEEAANKLNVTRATLNNWCKQAELPPHIVKNVKTLLGIVVNDSSDDLMSIIKSQQRTIENLSETIRTLTSK